MTVPELVDYATECYNQASDGWQAMFHDFWLLGRALRDLKNQMTADEFAAMLAKTPVSENAARKAIAVAEHFKTAEDLASLQIGEAVVVARSLPN